MFLKNKIILAPMAGVTDKPFRQMVRHFSNELLFTEMISATALCYHSKETAKMLDLSNETGPIGVQLVGSNLKEMSQAAQMAEQAGAAVLDINMGCPVKKLIKNNSGAALIKDPYLACQIVENIKKVISIPVTVKTRLGWDETTIDIVRFAKKLQNAGADSLTIHARTKAQGYRRKVDWSWIRKVKEVVSIPIIANGDVTDQKTASACMEQTTSDGIMIARAAMGKPWVLAEISGETMNINLKYFIEEHFDRLMAYYGHKGLFIARKHLAWYAREKSFVANFRRKVYAETDENQMRSLIKDFF